MIDKAIAKITDEMMKSKDPNILRIEEYLTAKCKSAEVAEKILNPDKTLKGALKVLRKEAEKRAYDGMTIMDGQEGFEMIDKYFGISDIKESESKREKIDILDLL